MTEKLAKKADIRTMTLNEYRKENKIDYPKWHEYLSNGLPTDKGTVNEALANAWIRRYVDKQVEANKKWNEENVSRQVKREQRKKAERKVKSERRG
jgi:hypothetical protein